MRVPQNKVDIYKVALIYPKTIPEIEGICNHLSTSLYSIMDSEEVVPTLLTAKIFEEKLPATYRSEWRSWRSVAAAVHRRCSADPLGAI